MTALVSSVATFFNGVMTMLGTLVTTITGDTSGILILGIVAVPLVGVAVGLLSRLLRQRV